MMTTEARPSLLAVRQPMTSKSNPEDEFRQNHSISQSQRNDRLNLQSVLSSTQHTKRHSHPTLMEDTPKTTLIKKKRHHHLSSSGTIHRSIPSKMDVSLTNKVQQPLETSLTASSSHQPKDNTLIQNHHQQCRHHHHHQQQQETDQQRVRKPQQNMSLEVFQSHSHTEKKTNKKESHHRSDMAQTNPTNKEKAQKNHATHQHPSRHQLDGVWGNPFLYKTLGSFSLLHRLLEGDALYHQNMNPFHMLTLQDKRIDQDSKWQEVSTSYQRVADSLMATLQSKWRRHTHQTQTATISSSFSSGISPIASQTDHIISNPPNNVLMSPTMSFVFKNQSLALDPYEEDDLILSRRDSFFRHFILLRRERLAKVEANSIVETTPIRKNKKEAFETPHTLATNFMNTHSSTTTSFHSNAALPVTEEHRKSDTAISSVLSFPDVKILLFALADVFVRIANVYIRSHKFDQALQCLEDARVVHDLPPLSSVIQWETENRGSTIQSSGIPMKNRRESKTRRKEELTPSSTPSLKSSLDLKTDGLFLSPLSACSSSPINHDSMSSSEDMETSTKQRMLSYHASFVTDFYTARINNITLHNYAVICSTHGRVINDIDKPESDIIHQSDNDTLIKSSNVDSVDLSEASKYPKVMQIYSECLRLKRMFLHDMKKKGDTTSSSRYNDAVISLTRTLTNIGVTKAESVSTTPHVLPPDGCEASNFSTSSVMIPNKSVGALIALSPKARDRLAKAEDFFKQALSILVQHNGLDDLGVAVILGYLGGVYFTQGRYDMSIGSYQEVLRIRSKSGKNNSNLIAAFSYNMALAQYLSGHFVNAKESSAYTLKILMKQVDDNSSIHNDIASVLYMLGLAQSSMGNYEDANKNLTRVLLIRKSLYSDHHLLVLNALIATGIACLNEGYFEKSMSKFHRVHSIRAKRLGTRHPATLDALRFIGLTHRDNGEVSLAIDVFADVLDGFRQQYGDDDVRVVDMMCLLAECYGKREMWTPAISICQKALDTLEAKYGRNHVSNAKVHIILAGILFDKEDFSGSLLSYENAIRVIDLVPNAKELYMESADLRYKMGRLYFQRGDYGKAIQSYSESIQIKRKWSNTLDWKILSSLGHAYYRNADLVSAYNSCVDSVYCQCSSYLSESATKDNMSNRITLRAIEAIRKTLEKLDNDTNSEVKMRINDELEFLASTLSLLGMINKDNGKLDDAIDSYNLSYSARNSQPHCDYVALSRTAETLGMLYFAVSDHQKALSSFNDALILKEKCHGDESVEVARTLNNIANVYFSMDSLDEAMVHYQRSLEIKKVRLGQDHDEVSNTLNNIAHVLCKSGKEDESLLAYMEVLRIRRIMHGNNSVTLAQTYLNIGEVHVKLGRMEEAMLCFEQSLSIKKRQKNSYNEEQARLMESLGKVYGSLKMWSKAELLYRDLVKIRSTYLGQENTAPSANTLHSLALTMIEQGLYRDALPSLYDALRIRSYHVPTSTTEELSELMNLINLCRSFILNEP